MSLNVSQQRERAKQMVERFVRRFQPSYRLLAYHAALPLVLTPELVNYLRVQFLRGQVPWVAEVDLLLSDLCRQVGYELYAMDTAVRAYLLEQMKQELGDGRIQEVARLLISYVKHLHQNNPYISPKELQAQQWAAMLYLNEQREKAIGEITQAFKDAASASTGIAQGLVNRAEMVRLAKITQELAPQLGAYENLVEYARIVTRVLTKSEDVESAALRHSYPIMPGLELSFAIKLEFTIVTLVPKEQISNRLIQVRDALSPLEAAGWRYQITQGEADYYTEELGDGVELDMISIPGGSFMMGSPEEEGYDSEKPQHQVTVSSFYMGRYPITQQQWRIVAGWERVERELETDPSRFKEDYEEIDRWQRPVERVSWEDAKEFCARLSKKTGKEYRLPTEAEWEYACRAGTTTPFHFGETISTELANYRGTDWELEGKVYPGNYGRGLKGIYREQTTPVGYFNVANNFGLSDMHGNVWEWCEDDWHDNYQDQDQDAPTDGSAWVTGESNIKVRSGGSWANDPDGCRSAIRISGTRDNRDNVIGFRVACVAPSTGL